VADKESVALAVSFLLGPQAAKITGQVLTVDGGASIMGGPLQDFEREPRPAGQPPRGTRHDHPLRTPNVSSRHPETAAGEGSPT
jgi:hypothetical protein